MQNTARPLEANTPNPAPQFTSYQKFVVAVLAFLQFTIILDFMILSPLGALLMPALHVTTTQFGLVISAYAFSAGISGLLAAGFADRFDRKKLLMFFYCGFLVGTLLCGIAPTYQTLLAARMITGVFGGVIGSIVFAITTDLFPFEMRGRVMGVVQTAFAASQILGIPAGLFFSNHWGWHAPFLMIVIVGAAVGALIAWRLQPVTGHLTKQHDRSPFQHLWVTVKTPRFVHAFATTALLSTGGFMLMPFGSAFSVHNLGISLDQLPLVYLITGICAMFSGPIVGRLADRFRKFTVFAWGSALSIVMVLIYTRLGITPLWLVVAISSVMFVGISARMISSQALMSAVPDAAHRGSFMSVSASVQQISGALAAAVAGMIVVEGTDGALQRYDWLGYCVVAAIAITVGMMYTIQRYTPERTIHKG